MSDSSRSPYYDRFYRRAFGVGTFLILAYALWAVLQPFLGAIAWALLIAFLLQPVHVRLTRKFRGRASLSSALLTAAAFFVAVGPLTAVGVAFVRQASGLVNLLQEKVGDVNVSSVSSLKTIPYVGRVLGWVEDHAPVSPEQLQSWALSGARTLLEKGASLGGSVFLGAIGTVVGFTIVLFLLFFFLRDGASMVKRFVSLVPMKEARKRELVDYLAAVTRAVVFGTLLTALLQGTLLAIGLAMAGLPSPVVFGVAGTMLALLPFGGTAIIWIPAVIYLGARGEYGWAIFLFIWGALLVSLVDNFLKPLLISGRAELPTLAAFLGVLGGVAAFGVVGLFLGPVLIGLALALLRFAEERGHASA